MRKRSLCLVIAASLLGACATTGARTDPPSPEQAYIDDIEGYARDLMGIDYEVASQPDMIDAGRTYCVFFDQGGGVPDILLEVLSGYDTTVDQPFTETETLLLTIYSIRAAADNFCPEHRSTLDDYLEEAGTD